MSSRVLRKLQREEEEKKNKLQNIQAEVEDDGSDEEPAPPPKVLNAFDMLNADASDDGTEPEEDETEMPHSIAKAAEMDTPASGASSNTKQKKSKKKKKNKKKEKQVKAASAVKNASSTEDNQLDEIDLALKSLSAKSVGEASAAVENVPLVDPAHIHLHRLLAVESKHLNALNEMKRLFGNVVLENENESPGTPRRRGRGPQQLDLGSALTAQHSPVSRGQGLTGLVLRKNFLIQGKEEWPRAAGGGLGMELVEKLDDGTTEYRFVHNTVYRDVQRQFVSCVDSMDPQRMIAMLIYNPYHVSTLLQVSEIAKQQGDHSVSGDLLERALFTFGRSVHSSFTNALSEGKARLNFDRPENREFWLAAWQYMNNLGQRGTWRTAYEWAKLILSLDPELDPYCIHKVIDQLAVRGGQNEHFMDLQHTQSSLWGSDGIWGRCPNFAISTALVENRLKKSRECRVSLQEAIKLYPWIFARLFQELNLEDIPKSIWGTTPRSPREKLDCETYVAMAKDIWNTPEATSLLVEVASYAEPTKSQPLASSHITLDEARHALLSGIPSIINCIPRSFTTQSTTSFDPFPPLENLESYNANPSSLYYDDRGELFDDEDGEDNDDRPLPPNLDRLEVDPVTARRTDVRGLQSFFARLIPWLGRSEAAIDEDDTLAASPGPSNEMEAAIAISAREAHEAGLSTEAIEERGNRLLQALENAVVSQRDVTEHPNVFDSVEHDDEEQLRNLLSATGPSVLPSSSSSSQAQAQSTNNASNSNPTPRATIEAATEQSQDSSIIDDNDGGSPNSRLSRAAPPPLNISRPPTHLDSSPADSETEPARGRHWLAGRGLLDLKTFTARHGTDASQWPSTLALPTATSSNLGKQEDESIDGSALLTDYATALLALPAESDRRFILDFALPQGAGREVRELVVVEVERLKRLKK